MLSRYGVENPLLLESSIRKSREEMIKKYGVEYGFKSEIIQRRIMASSLKLKDYTFPNGRITKVMGYENIMLDILLEMHINEDDILTNLDCPVIEWFDNNGKLHKHIPDIFIKSQNRIIEVKSEYTSRELYIENILLKKKYAEDSGYIYQIYVIDKKLKKIKYEIK